VRIAGSVSCRTASGVTTGRLGFAPAHPRDRNRRVEQRAQIAEVTKVLRRRLVVCASVAGSLTTGGLVATPPVVAGAARRVAARHASVKYCRYVRGHGPRNHRHLLIYHVAARNMTCADALDAISDGTQSRTGRLSTPHFSCRVFSRYIGGNVYGGTTKCSHPSRRGTFQYRWIYS
jgi:hypothetical protein